MLRREPLLAFCRSLPHVTEDWKWGNDLCFSIGGKMFAVFGPEGGTFSCKTREDDFHALTGLDGVVPAPYVARFHWVLVQDPQAIAEAQARTLLAESYELVKAGLPARLRASLGGATPKGGAKKSAAEKPAAKTTAAKKLAAKKPVAKKVAAKAPAAKKPAAKKPAAKKAAAKQVAPDRAASKVASRRTGTKAKKPARRRP